MFDTVKAKPKGNHDYSDNDKSGFITDMLFKTFY